LYELLAKYLEANGVAATHAVDGRRGLAALEGGVFDAVLLDVMMPGMDGLEVCRRIRARGSTPVILLSSRGEEVDRVTGLSVGADDYVVKPFSTRELCARIRAIGRRLRPTVEAPVTAGWLRIDRARFEVSWRDRPVVLTRSELELLAALAERRGFVLARERLLDLARGDGLAVTERTVDTFIKRIRKKLREVDPEFDEIETVFGVGYRYRQ